MLQGHDGWASSRIIVKGLVTADMGKKKRPIVVAGAVKVRRRSKPKVGQAKFSAKRAQASRNSSLPAARVPTERVHVVAIK